MSQERGASEATDYCPAKPNSRDFWQEHEKALRLARLTQAAATIYATGKTLFLEDAVGMAFNIERKIIDRISKEKQ